MDDCRMTTLTVTARGQVTFKREVLQHLGIKPGEKIEFQLLADGRALLKAAAPAVSIDAFVGLLAGKSSKVASIEEISAAAAAGWAGGGSPDGERWRPLQRRWLAPPA